MDAYSPLLSSETRLFKQCKKNNSSVVLEQPFNTLSKNFFTDSDSKHIG